MYIMVQYEGVVGYDIVGVGVDGLYVFDVLGIFGFLDRYEDVGGLGQEDIGQEFDGGYVGFGEYDFEGVVVDFGYFDWLVVDGLVVEGVVVYVFVGVDGVGGDLVVYGNWFVVVLFYVFVDVEGEGVFVGGLGVFFCYVGCVVVSYRVVVQQ